MLDSQIIRSTINSFFQTRYATMFVCYGCKLDFFILHFTKRDRPFKKNSFFYKSMFLADNGFIIPLFCKTSHFFKKYIISLISCVTQYYDIIYFCMICFGYCRRSCFPLMFYKLSLKYYIRVLMNCTLI